MEKNMESAALFCAARCAAAKEAMEMASKSCNHDFLATWDSPGNSAFWWQSFNGNDTTRTRVEVAGAHPTQPTHQPEKQNEN